MAAPRRDGCRFPAAYRCTELIYYEHYRDVRDAIAQQTQLEKWSRAKKIELINRLNPRWIDLETRFSANGKRFLRPFDSAQGKVIAMLFATLVYVFALLSLGLLVATKAENQMQALQMSMTYMLPSVFFSGFVFPRETMPWIFYALSTLLPATYFISLMRAIILRGATFFEYWPHLIILIVMSILLFCFCALRFRKKIG